MSFATPGEAKYIDHLAIGSRGESLLNYARTGLVYAMRRPLFDLEEPTVNSPRSSWAPIYAYEAIGKQVQLLLERIPTEALRGTVFRSAGDFGLAQKDPCAIPMDDRGERWSHLCEMLDKYRSLRIDLRGDLHRLLNTLGCFNFALSLPCPEVDGEQAARIVASRGFCRHALAEGRLGSPPRELVEVVDRMPAQSYARHLAAKLLLIYCAKSERDLPGAQRLRDIAAEYFLIGASSLTDFERSVCVSRFYRAASFVPFLHGDATQVAQELSQAEELARTAPAADALQEELRKDLLVSALESRQREALWLGDLSLALARGEEARDLDPWDAKVWMQHAETLMRMKRWEDAADEYAMAARIGPPGIPICHYLRGHCWEQLGELDLALAAYLDALDSDGFGLAPLKGIGRIAGQCGKPELGEWSADRLAALAGPARAAA